MLLFDNVTGFLWDEGNKNKNFKKHNVNEAECEEVFFDTEKKILNDILHSNEENRFILIGKTKNKRYLFLVFTIREDKIRVISARDLNKKERKLV